MKVIFLDVDGVLNCASDFTRIKHENGLCLSQVKIDRLYTIQKATGASIVLSSTWRLHQDAMEYLKLRKVEFLDTTPFLMRQRGHEIESWLKKHPEATDYIILDDDVDMLDCQMPFFIKTKFLGKHCGLQDEHVAKAIAILNNTKEN